MAMQGKAFATAQEVRVVHPPGDGDDDGELVDVPRDGKTLGEISTRGNIVMKEVSGQLPPASILIFLIPGRLQYFRDPEATKKAFRGGSFISGDLAVMYPDGTVAIMDRSKDIIISGGEVRVLYMPSDQSLIFLFGNPLECIESSHRTRWPISRCVVHLDINISYQNWRATRISSKSQW